MVLQQEATTYNDAFNQLAEGIASAQQQRVKVGSFYEFLRDIWSQSFEHPEYFKAWHVGVCLLYTSPSPRDGLLSRMPSSA